MLFEKLFGDIPPETAKVRSETILERVPFSSKRAIAIYVHDEMLSSAHPLMHKPIPKIFVFDIKVYGKWPLKRLQFVADCLSELMDVEVWIGNTAEVLQERNVGQVITQDTPNKQIKNLLEPFNTSWQPEVKFVEAEISEKRLKRFSRYWDKAGTELFGDIASSES
jgi:deoxyribodipyrimidine photo-lyase